MAAILMATAMVASACIGAPARVAAGQPEPTVTASAETPQSPTDADDPAIWVDRSDPARSVVIGTDKNPGLGVYDLTGKQIQFLANLTPNNVDLRDGVPLGGALVSLVVAAYDNAKALRAYRLDPITRNLVDVAARPLTVGLRAHGLCLYRSARSEKLYAFANDLDGRVEQWELYDDGNGKVDARLVRGPWVVAQGLIEGCVADDELGQLYISEERRGVWKYGAEPLDPTTEGMLVDQIGPGGHLVADVEGLAILARPGESGYLLVSSQGDNAFAVYRRQAPHSFVGRFRVGPDRVDGCEDSDGSEVTGETLGPAYPDGLFICQDGRDEAGTNFKLVSLEQILRALAVVAAPVSSSS